MSLLWTEASADPPRPPLPTPCLGGNCGASAVPFVQSGVAGAVTSGNTLNVTQSTDKAILNWANFSIANGYTVNFAQPSATAATLNKIWSADPSVIAGQLKANGQIYLYNQNGIVFDKGAQVNVGGLVASTLAVPDQLFEKGILSGSPASPVFQSQGGAPGNVDVKEGATLTAADGGRIMLLGSAVTNRGSIATPDGQTILGAATGNVYLAASSSPDMRGLLIAVDGGAAPGAGTAAGGGGSAGAGAASAPPVAGSVTNVGQVFAVRGNITLAGLLVNQQGQLSATTSVSANGSIYLVAGDASGSTFTSPIINAKGSPTAFGNLLPDTGGAVVLAPGSVTQVTPETSDTTTVTAEQKAQFIPSQVQIAGRTVAMEGNASVQAPGGQVNIYASANPYTLVTRPTLTTNDTSGSVYIDKDSTIDVSGLTQVSAPATQNIIKVTLETDDLQDDPLLRDGFLHGTSVTVDITHPPSLFNIQPYVNNIGTTISQLSTNAGGIQLNATGEVITRAGSTLNVSGGSVAYQGGYGPSTTKLIGADGRVYDISKAPSNIQYTGTASNYSYTDPTWGTSTQASYQTYYPGYTQGSNAGAITIQAPQAYLRGAALAQTVAGIYQRNPSTLAAGGRLVLGCQFCTDASGTVTMGLNGGVTFDNGLTDTLGANALLPDGSLGTLSLPATALLSPAQLTQAGFSSFGIYSNGPVLLPANAPLSLATNGAVAVKSTQSIDLGGAITAPGGSVALQTTGRESGDVTPHTITLAPASVVDLSGRWINDSPRVTPQPGTTPTVIDGGSFSASAFGNVVVGAGSLINVSGGGWINQSNQLATGAAGKISLSANFSVTPATPTSGPFTGTVSLGSGATLLGASLTAGKGGTLALQSGSVTVGTSIAGTPGELLLAPAFFTQGGFANYSITGQNDLIIGNPLDTGVSAPITIAPIQQNLAFTQSSLAQRSGASAGSFTQLQTLPAALRQPANVSFSTNASDAATPADFADVWLAKDATIVTDPGGTVTLQANSYNASVHVLGSILAPAGTINVLLAPTGGIASSSDPGFLPAQRIELGSGSLLSAVAYAKIDTLDPLGYREGSILGGGTVSLTANKGFIVSDPGSAVDVSAVVGTLDLIGPNGVTATTVAGRAGTINLAAREGWSLQGVLRGQAATINGAPVSGASGGTLNLKLGSSPYLSTVTPNNPSPSPYSTSLRTITLVGSSNGGAPLASPAVPLQSGTALLDVGALEAGGFDNLVARSSDVIAFQGAVSVHASASITLDAPLFAASQGTRANVSAPYVAVGNYFNNPDYYGSGNSTFFGDPNGNPSVNVAAVLNPKGGPGILNVNAQLIDVRGISGWSGFATENFTSSGDIRLTGPLNASSVRPPVGLAASSAFEGAFNTSASLTLTGGQLYPTTAAQFAINDLPSSGGTLNLPTATVVTFASASSGTPPAAPLSAAGNLTVNATQINQNGVLRAPLGTVAFNGVSLLDPHGNVLVPSSVTLGAGSLTSVSADGMLIPYGSTANGIQWTQSPGLGYTTPLSQPPSKQVNLSASSVSVNGTVDLSGGGDLYAYEFIAGHGGSVDVLDPANLGASGLPKGKTIFTYAVVPGLGTPFAPFDAQYYTSGTKFSQQTTTGLTISLSGVPGLPAGTYSLLPARYALLPGAYAVQVVQQNSNVPAGSTVQQPDGSYLVAGRLGVPGTSVLDTLTSTVMVSPGSVVRTQSQYTDSYANAFFNNLAAAAKATAPQLPADAGQLLLSATNSFNLKGVAQFGLGSFVSGTDSDGKSITQQGRGGDVAITGQKLVVVDSVMGPSSNGALQLDVNQLNGLHAQTLILGAFSTSTPTGQLLTLGSAQTDLTQSVELKNTAALTSPQVILAAQDSVSVDAGAQIVAGASTTSSATSASTAPESLSLPGGGALLRVSGGPAAKLVVDPTTLPNTLTGTVNIAAQANVQAAGSLLLYGSEGTTLASDAQVSAPAVSLYSSRISLGDVPASVAAQPGLTLTSQLLGSLKGLTDLTLGSSSTIDFYGTVQLGTPRSAAHGLNSIGLDAAGLGGYGAGDKILQAANIVLTNSSGSSSANFAAAPDGTGALQLIATGTGRTGVGVTDPFRPGQLTLGAGTKTLSGFGSVALRADGDIYGLGTGSLLAGAAPVSLTSAAIVGAGGADQSILTTGAVQITGSAAPSSLSVSAAGLGGKLTIDASDIQQNGTLNFPAGVISLTARTGNVTLGGGSSTSAAGAVKNFTVTDTVAAGGSIAIVADAGKVTIGQGATVDLSGASSPGRTQGDAGSLAILAPHGTFTFAGSVLKGGAASGRQRGNFRMDVASGLGITDAGNGFTALAALLTGGGFKGSLDLRTHNDSVTIDSTTKLQANSFQLTADSGSIDVLGTINTSGGTTLDPDGGSIALWAGRSLTLEGGAQLLANAGSPGPLGANGAALPGHGGNITLGIGTLGGAIDLHGGSTLQMKGSDATSDGLLTLRAPTLDPSTGALASSGSSIAVTEIASTISARNSIASIIVEGYNVYNMAAGATLGGNQNSDVSAGGGAAPVFTNLDIGPSGADMLFADAAKFAQNTASIIAGLLRNSPNATGLALQVRPGIEVRGQGDLTLASVWNLNNWNVALGSPVNLTLRTTGNLIFNASLSDGFSGSTFGESATDVHSGSYRLAAGADLSAANPLAVNAVVPPIGATSLDAAPNSGNVIVTPGNLIRTGDGNIDIAAGGDLLLGYTYGGVINGNIQVTESDPQTSAIYTAGIKAVDAPTDLFTRPALGRGGGTPSYPTDGGNISITAADDIRSALSGQLVTDWLWRRGFRDPTRFAPNTATSWYVMFPRFQQGIGALGGGNLTLSAGRDVVNTSAVIPTTGRLVVPTGARPAASDLWLTGGGNLRVLAGGDVISGVYENDWGSASVVAGGALRSSANSTYGQAYPTQVAAGLLPGGTELYPILVVGNGEFDVSARAGVTLDGVTNSTTLPIVISNLNVVASVFGNVSFFAYAPSSNPGILNLTSAGGNIVLNRDDPNFMPVYLLGGSNSPYEQTGDPATYLALYPSTLNIVSLSGDVSLDHGIEMFPSASGNLNLLAAGSVGGPVITMSEADPALVPTAQAPINVNAYAGVHGAPLPAAPLHLNDSQPISVVAGTGDIDGASLSFPKAANVIAGGNISSLVYDGKNLTPSDVTLIAAGGDVTYATPTLPPSNTLQPNGKGITIAGPGYVELLAGKSIDLGDGSGVDTTGSLTDVRLPSAGAAVVVGAGLGANSDGTLRQPAAQAFVNSYLAPDDKGNPGANASDLVSYMQQLYPDANAKLSYPAALTAFNGLRFSQQLPLLSQVLAEELSATGLDHNLKGTGYDRGYQAIATLFPTKDVSGHPLTYRGDLNMFYSQLKTQQGGDIDLLLPGGSVIVGIPNPPSPAILDSVKGGNTGGGLVQIPAAVNLGILVLGPGAIQGFADQSFEVNQSRILTLEGGNITLWASNGDIDAGKGAKSASGAPPPVIQTDANGNLFVNPSNAVSGSGIGQLLTKPGIKPGLVNLIAPKGTVNAGDAGIRVAGNLNIAAVQVIGANNITVGGTSTGVPTSEAGALSGALSGANSLGDAGKSAVEDLNSGLNGGANFQQLNESLTPAFITVKMFCLGVECETH